jgi:hypothetical protein
MLDLSILVIFNSFVMSRNSLFGFRLCSLPQALLSVQYVCKYPRDHSVRYTHPPSHGVSRSLLLSEVQTFWWVLHEFPHIPFALPHLPFVSLFLKRLAQIIVSYIRPYLQRSRRGSVFIFVWVCDLIPFHPDHLYARNPYQPYLVSRLPHSCTVMNCWPLGHRFAFLLCEYCVFTLVFDSLSKYNTRVSNATPFYTHSQAT